MTTRTWSEAKGAALVELREAYQQEVERLAEELRPRFEAGELHAYPSADESTHPGHRAACPFCRAA